MWSWGSRCNASTPRPLRSSSQGPAPRPPSSTLLSDLAELTLARWRFLDLAPQSVPSLRQAVQRDPRLLARMVTLGQQNEALDIPLIEAREGMVTGDPRARVAAHLVGSIARAAARDFLAPDNSDSYSTVFVRWVNDTGDLLATQDAVQAPSEPGHSYRPGQAGTR